MIESEMAPSDWKRLRNQAIARAEGRCEACGKGRVVDVLRPIVCPANVTAAALVAVCKQCGPGRAAA